MIIELSPSFHYLVLLSISW